MVCNYFVSKNRMFCGNLIKIFSSYAIARFKSDHNEDNSVEILSLWLERTRSFYHSVNFTPDLDSPALRDTETNQTQWPEERYLDIIRMKEEAFQHARNIWADFTFVSVEHVCKFWS